MSKPKFSLDKGALLALLPFVGYLLAYNYEKGFLSSFNIPASYVQVSVEAVIVSISSLALSLMIIYPFIDVFAPILQLIDKSSEKGKAWFSTIILTLISCAFVFIFMSTTTINKIIISLSWFFCWIFYYFGVPLILSRKKTMEAKLREVNKIDKNVPSFIDFIWDKPVLFSYWSLFLLVFLFAFLAHMVGVKKAASEKQFLVYNKEEPYAILRTYRNYNLAVGYDKESKIINNKVLIIQNDTEIEYSSENIGPLTKKRDKITLSKSIGNVIGDLINKMNYNLKRLSNNIIIFYRLNFLDNK